MSLAFSRLRDKLRYQTDNSPTRALSEQEIKEQAFEKFFAEMVDKMDAESKAGASRLILPTSIYSQHDLIRLAGRLNRSGYEVDHRFIYPPGWGWLKDPIALEITW